MFSLRFRRGLGRGARGPGAGHRSSVASEVTYRRGRPLVQHRGAATRTEMREAREDREEREREREDREERGEERERERVRK